MRKKSITEKNFSPAITCTAPWRLMEVKPLKNYQLKVKFIDGTEGLVEMVNLILNPKAGVFEKLKDPEIFNQVHLIHGVVTWPDEIDLAPDAMYEEIKQHGKWIVDCF